jgi:hypothetical protein
VTPTVISRRLVVLAPETGHFVNLLDLPSAERIVMKDVSALRHGRIRPVMQRYGMIDFVASAVRFALSLRRLSAEFAWTSAVTRQLEPCVALTDNTHLKFLGALGVRHPQTRVVAVQSGHQTERDLHSSRPSYLRSNGRGYQIGADTPPYHDVVLTWNQYSINQLHDNGVKYRYACAVGSVMDALHQARGITPGTPRSELAIVLMKPRTFHFPDTIPYRVSQQHSRRVVYMYLRRYCDHHRLSPTMIMRALDADGAQRQQQDLHEVYGTDYTISDWSTRFGSYDAVMSAHVVVGDQSSLLVEALGRGRRALSVTMSDDPSMQFPFPGPWALQSPTYEQFADRLDQIRGMSDQEWKTLVGDLPSQAIAQVSSVPAHRFVERFVRHLLSGHSPERAEEMIRSA